MKSPRPSTVSMCTRVWPIRNRRRVFLTCPNYDTLRDKVTPQLENMKLMSKKYTYSFTSVAIETFVGVIGPKSRAFLRDLMQSQDQTEDK